MQIPNPPSYSYIFVHLLLLPHYKYLTHNEFGTKHKFFLLCTNVFVTLYCHCTQFFQTGHTLPYGLIYHTEEYYCCDEEPLKYWVIERHFINALTHSKIIFMFNTTSPLAIIVIKILRGVIKDNELFFFENKVLSWLQLQLQGRLFNHLLKL